MSEPCDNTRKRPLADDQCPGFTLNLQPGLRVPGMPSWILEKKLGSGGFGAVWLVAHEWDKTQGYRAVKLFTRSATPDWIGRHEKDVVVQIMQGVGRHPNIVPLLDANLDADVPFLVYEYVAGPTLTHILTQKDWSKGTASERLDFAIPVLRGLASALATIHALKPPIVHRDLKPDNIILEGGKVPRITDFGIGGLSASVPKEIPARVPTALRSAGTQGYASLQQITGQPPKPSDDVYSLGAVAFRTLSDSNPPIDNQNTEKHLVDRGVIPALAKLIAQSLSPRDGDRPQNGSVWLDAFENAVSETESVIALSLSGTSPVLIREQTEAPTPGTATSTSGPRRSVRWLAVLVTFLCALAVIAVVVAQARRVGDSDTTFATQKSRSEDTNREEKRRNHLNSANAANATQADSAKLGSPSPPSAPPTVSPYPLALAPMPRVRAESPAPVPPAGVRPPAKVARPVEGLVVTGVTPNFPAQQAGFAPGDVIVRLNGMHVRSLTDWVKHLATGDNEIYYWQKSSETLIVCVVRKADNQQIGLVFW